MEDTAMHYLLFYEVSADYLSRRAEFREAHLEKAWKAAGDGELVLGGALAEPVDEAVLLFHGDSPDVAEKFAKSDPYVTNSLVKRWHVREWTTVVGKDAATPVRPNTGHAFREREKPERLIWTERKFNFDIAAWMFPNILERIRGTPSRLEDRVRNVSPEILVRKQEHKWSVQEQIGHLLDLESLNQLRMDEYEAGKEILAAADINNRATHEAGYNQKPLGSILEKFRKERSRFVKRLETAEDSLVGRIALHPRLRTPMRLIDYIYFIAEHDDHHLARITELLQQ